MILKHKKYCFGINMIKLFQIQHLLNVGF